MKAGKRKADKRESTITRGGDNRYYENVNGKTIDITDQIPFEIPSSWEWVRLEEVLLSTTNKQPSGDFFDYIDIDSIDNTKQSIRQAKHIKTADAPSRAARGLKEGDVISGSEVNARRLQPVAPDSEQESWHYSNPVVRSNPPRK